PPEKYTFELRVRGLKIGDEDALIPSTTHRAEVFLPLDYPRRPPFARMVAGLSSEHRPAEDLHRRPLERRAVAGHGGGADRGDDLLPELQREEPAQRQGGCVGRAERSQAAAAARRRDRRTVTLLALLDRLPPICV